MGRKKECPVYEYFEESGEKGSVCKICRKEFKITKGSNLAVHLKLHPGAYAEFKEKKILGEGELRTTKKQEQKTVSIKTSVAELNEICLELVTKNGRPFSMIHDSGMLKLLKPLYDSFGESPPNHVNLGIQIAEKAEKLRTYLRLDMKDRLISLKMDVASRFDRGFLGVSVQYEKNGQIETRPIGLVELLASHTSEYLANEVFELMHVFGLKISQIISNTTDNGTNMIKLTRILNQKAQKLVDSKTPDVVEEEVENGEEEVEEEKEYDPTDGKNSNL
jgi:hypothetical protein